jgi:hypothetical protein
MQERPAICHGGPSRGRQSDGHKDLPAMKIFVSPIAVAVGRMSKNGGWAHAHVEGL